MYYVAGASQTVDTCSEVVSSRSQGLGSGLAQAGRAHSMTIGYRTDAHSSPNQTCLGRNGGQAQAHSVGTRAWISDKFGGLDLSCLVASTS